SCMFSFDCCFSVVLSCLVFVFFFSSRRRHTRSTRDWSSDVCSSDLVPHYRNAGTSVVTNKALNAAYRAAGRPEAVFVMERLMDQIGRASCREKSVNLGGRRIMKKKTSKRRHHQRTYGGVTYSETATA